MRVDLTRALSLFAACCLLLMPATASRAACASAEKTLYLPIPKESQAERLILPFLASRQQPAPQKLNVRFVPGKGGSNAWSRLARDPGNGCSFALVQFPSFLFLADLNDGMYRQEDLAPVSVFASAPNALWVSETSRFQTLADLIGHVRNRNAAPGSYVFFSGIGSYTDQHLATLQFNRAAGVKASYLPVLGSSQAIGEVAAQKADACWGYALSPESMPGMRALAVAAPDRSPALPDVPTFRELQLDVINLSYFGIALPSTAAQEDRQELFSTTTNLLATPEIQGALQAEGFNPVSVPREQLPVFIGEQQRLANSLLEDYALIPRELLRR